MGLKLGDIAPNFQASTTEGLIDFHQLIHDSWAILFSHPKDFTPVCTTELGLGAQLAPEFKKRGVKMVALSVDKLEEHHAWIRDIEEYSKTIFSYPIIADENKSIATLYDMIHPQCQENYTVRSVYIIGPDKKIKLMMTYPASCGRNFHEILRVIDSLQLSYTQPLATPANWKPGDDCIISLTLNDEEARKKFPQGFNAPKPYLRFTNPFTTK